MKAIMYHYVRKFEKDLPNFRYLSYKNFQKQLDFFDKNFGFITRDQWNKILKSKRVGEYQGKILLTFDDGLSCHYNFVFPELNKRGLWGIFYISTNPYKNNKLLDVHKIHLLCGAFEGKDLIRVLKLFLDEEMIPDKKIEEFRKETYITQNNFEGVSEFKRILNYYINYSFREILINKVANYFGYEFDVNKFYLSREKIKDMSRNGHVIGSHTVTHPVMSKLSREEQSYQIKDSFSFLKDLEISSEKTYCHPYGGFHTFNKDTIELLKNNNVNYSFSVEPREINDNDLKNNKQFLPRFDCNLFPNGKAS